MRSIEYKLARLEEQNTSLRRKLRHQENEIRRLSVRESQLKEARRMPLLQKRLDAALIEREEFECQLAETRSREAKLTDEVNFLRTFVKLSENSELAKAAQQCANYERIQGDLRDLGEQLRTIATERDEYKKRAFLSCEEAEYYRDKCNVLIEEKEELERYIKRLLAEQTSLTATTAESTTAVAATSSFGDAAAEKSSLCRVSEDDKESCRAEDVEHLWQSLKEERTRSKALQETIDTLYEHQREKRRSYLHERRPCCSVTHETDTDLLERSGADTLVQTLRQQLHLAEGECTLLKNRWRALREQNQTLLDRVTGQERLEASWRNQLHQLSEECERLKRELDFISSARSLGSYHHTESTGSKPLEHQDDSTR